MQENLISTNFSKEQIHLNSDLGLNKLFILQNNWKKILTILSIFQISWSLERQKPKV